MTAKSKSRDPTPDNKAERTGRASAGFAGSSGLLQGGPRAWSISMVDNAVHELVIRRLADAGRILMMLPVTKKRRPAGAPAPWPDEVQTYFDCVFARTDWHDERYSERHNEYWRLALSPFSNEKACQVAKKRMEKRYEEVRRGEHREALARLRSVTRMHTSVGNDRRLGEALGWLLLIRRVHWRRVVALRMLTRTNSAGHRKPLYSWKSIALLCWSKEGSIRHYHDYGIQDIVDGLARDKQIISQ